MFIRTRHRKLKGQGSPAHRAYLKSTGRLVTESTSFDLVRAVRVDGKPRQEFVAGLGSWKEGLGLAERVFFWAKAVRRFRGQGLSDDQVMGLLHEMVCKGAVLLSREDIDEFAAGWPQWYRGWVTEGLEPIERMLSAEPPRMTSRQKRTRPSDK